MSDRDIVGELIDAVSRVRAHDGDCLDECDALLPVDRAQMYIIATELRATLDRAERQTQFLQEFCGTEACEYCGILMIEAEDGCHLIGNANDENDFFYVCSLCWPEEDEVPACK